MLLCDEPTGALDYETGVLVLRALADVNARLGATTLLITHNVAIADMADRVVRMTSGTVGKVRENARRASPMELRW